MGKNCSLSGLFFLFEIITVILFLKTANQAVVSQPVFCVVFVTSSNLALVYFWLAAMPMVFF